MVISWAIFLSSSADPKSPTWWKKLIAWWTPLRRPQGSWNQKVGDWDPQSIPLLPHHQPIRGLCMSWYPVTLSSHTVFKNPTLKAIREFRSFEHEMPILPVWPSNKHAFLYDNPVLAAWLCFMSRTQFGLIN